MHYSVCTPLRPGNRGTRLHIERRIPLLPLSREITQIDRLKRQLAVYRLVFGQPRQDDLLAHLASVELAPQQLDAWRISLEPRVEAE